MDQFIEESKNTLADLVSVKGLALLDPDVKIEKVDPSKRILRLSIRVEMRCQGGCVVIQIVNNFN